MKELENNEIWSINYFCLGDGPSDANEDEGCYRLFNLTWEDISYREFTHKDGNIEGIYSFFCPSCHKETIIDKNLIPDLIKHKIKNNNGYSEDYVRKYLF